MKDWEKYESQIFSKLRSEFPNADIKKDQRIKGLFSEKKRQIDVLVKAEIVGKKVVVVIDCKKFSQKIDIKVVESFIGFLEDVKANLGILITTVGYTSGAKKRVNGYTRDIRLDIVKFEDFDDYEFPWYDCKVCSDPDNYRYTYVTWGETYTFQNDGLHHLFDLGKCSFCGATHIKCQGCGEYMDINESIFSECGCGLSYSLKWTNPRYDPSEFEIIVKDKLGAELKKKV